MHQVTIGASSIADTDSTEFRRRRGSNISVLQRTQFITTGIGRNKALKSPALVRSDSIISANPRVRSRPECKITCKTIAEISGVVVLPPVQAPTGEMLLGEAKFNKSRLTQLDTHSINLTITGNRLTELEFEFIASTLKNEQVMRKTSGVSPGGIFIDSAIPHTDGKQTLVGTIFFLPSETKRQETEIELKYFIRAFNATTNRDYTIETGFFTLYQA